MMRGATKSAAGLESGNFCLTTSHPVLVGLWLGNALVLNLLEVLGNCGKLDQLTPWSCTCNPASWWSSQSRSPLTPGHSCSVRSPLNSFDLEQAGDMLPGRVFLESSNASSSVADFVEQGFPRQWLRLGSPSEHLLLQIDDPSPNDSSIACTHSSNKLNKSSRMQCSWSLIGCNWE